MQFNAGSLPELRSKGEAVQSLSYPLPFFLLSHHDHSGVPLQASTQQKEVSQQSGETKVRCVEPVDRQGRSVRSSVFLAGEPDRTPRHLDT